MTSHLRSHTLSGLSIFFKCTSTSLFAGSTFFLKFEHFSWISYIVCNTLWNKEVPITLCQFKWVKLCTWYHPLLNGLLCKGPPKLKGHSSQSVFIQMFFPFSQTGIILKYFPIESHVTFAMATILDFQSTLVKDHPRHIPAKVVLKWVFFFTLE